MKNYFNDLHNQGITHAEISLEDLQKLLIEGKITESQFSKILMDNLGTEKFMKIMQETLEETYGKDLLTKPIPKELKMLCQDIDETRKGL